VKKEAHEGAGTTASPLVFDGLPIVLVHGATSGPWVFDEWADSWSAHWPDVDVRVPDLQKGLDVAHATMSDYVDRVLAAVGGRPAVLCGWSMGGLVAMMAAQRCQPVALVVIEPSVPVEIDGGDPTWPLAAGTYDAESTYGPAVPGMRHRPESLLARGERKRGISVPAIACPLLVVAGHDYVDSRGRPVAEMYGAELMEFPELSHFQLVADPRVRDAVAQWVDSLAPEIDFQGP
jgi:pimeloyl-ACP methyl ester carboxylesterase